MTTRAVVCFMLGTLAVACNKQSSEPSGTVESAKAEPTLITGAAAGPTGYQWERVNRAAAGSVEVPSGEGWKKEDGASLEVSNEKLGITVMIQTQPGVPPEARDEYMKSLVDANKRDAPKYATGAQKTGQVKSQPAAVLDGKFDNGSAFATRDYVLFAKNGAFAVMVRGPTAQEAEVYAVSDHIAASYQ